MKLLRFLALMFIRAVGVTHPSIEEQGRAALCMGLLLATIILFLCALFSWTLSFMHISA